MAKQYQFLHKGTNDVRRNSDKDELSAIYRSQFARQSGQDDFNSPQAAGYAESVISGIRAASPDPVELSQFTDVRYS